MTALTVPQEARRARVGVLGMFAVVGFTLASWLVNIPFVQSRANISHATLGVLLLILGTGGVLGMQVAGHLLQRLGARAVLLVASVAAAVAVNAPVWTTEATSLGAALLVYGLVKGTCDIAMNDAAVKVEQAYDRPIMSTFHALWSIGGALGAALGAVTQSVGLDARVSVGLASLLAAVAGVVFAFLLQPAGPRPSATPVTDTAGHWPKPPGHESVRTGTRALTLAVLAFALMLAEGVANDWGPLHAVEHLERSHRDGSITYGVFAVAMTTGRLTVDRIARRFGPAFVVRYGSLMAGIGIVIVIVSPLFTLTLLGWAVYGLGLAGVVPQLFTAAGNLGSKRQSIVLSRVVGVGYAGQLAGPALVGAIASWVGLSTSFILPMVLCFAAAVVAPSVVSSITRVARTTPPADLERGN